MRRDLHEHLIRAEGDLLGEDTISAIGGQAIVASVPLPSEVELMRSMEADLLPLDDPDEAKADRIDGCSVRVTFEDTHGVHADGVSANTGASGRLEGTADRNGQRQNERPVWRRLRKRAWLIHT